MDINTIFQQLRRERHLSQSQVSTGIISVSTLSRFEAGKTSLSAVTLVALLNRMQADWSEFVPSKAGGSANRVQLVRKMIVERAKDPLVSLLKYLEHEDTLSPQFVWLCKLVLMAEFNMSFSDKEEVIQAAMAHLYQQEYWPLVSLEICSQLVLLTPLTSLPTLLSTNARQGALRKHDINFTPYAISNQLRGVLRLLRENPDHSEPAQHAFGELANIEPQQYEDEFAICLTRELLGNTSKGACPLDFSAIANIFNTCLILGSADFLRSWVPLMAPIMRQQGFTTDLFVVQDFYSDYA
ncbi:helix-turn-helix domain-containing protein [Schleiferilactobacillus shenzhenensis]|nr:helix-turn-helix transcriptional regulator [Schleiferilactobacillus shenzhenensis]